MKTDTAELPMLALSISSKCAGQQRNSVSSEVVTAKSAIERIRESTLAEKWLPLGLRSVIAEEVGTFLQFLTRPDVELGDLAKCIGQLSASVDEYGEFVSESKAVAEIRLLNEHLSLGASSSRGSGNRYYCRALVN